MHVAIPFYMDTIGTSFGRPERMWGRAVANHGFVEALAMASPPLRLTLLVPTRRDVATLRGTLLAHLPRAVNVVPFCDLADFLTADPIDVLHVLEPNLWIGAHVRNYLACAPFVVTGMTHSLANEHFLNWALLNNANGVSANDCLVCTTPSAKAVIDRVFRRLAASQPEFSAPMTAVIPLGVKLPPSPGNRPGQRARLGLREDDFVVLSFCRFNPQFKMDLMPVLNLVALLAPRLTRPLRVVLAGAADNGAYARFLQERVQERGLAETVRFALDSGESEKYELFSAADVFLSLSDNIQETFGLTVVEAMTAGLPVVASDWDGYKALVEDGTTGYLVPTRMLADNPPWEALLALQDDALVHMYGAQTTAVDLEVAATRLATLAANPALAKRMGVAGSASAALLSWSQVVERYRELWCRLEKPRPLSGAPGDRSPRSSALAFLADFGSYPTAQVSNDDRFLTSALGNLLLTGKTSANIYDHLEEFLDLHLLKQLLLRFAVETEMRAVLKEYKDAENRRPDQIVQNVLWLYKYGFLEARPALSKTE